MIDCSKTENFLTEIQKICLTVEACHDCPLSRVNNDKNLHCSVFLTAYPKESIRIVQEWSDEHLTEEI